MIGKFKHKGLRELFDTGKTSKINNEFHKKILRCLDIINSSRKITELNIPGFDFHSLRGKPQRYTMHINGPRCITFEWEGEDAINIDFEQYH